LKNIVIIGNGISGITLARHVRKLSDHKITVISSETEHFFSRTALMYVYMGHMKFEHTKPYEDWFWKKNRIDLVFDRVEKIDFSNKNLQLKSGNTISYNDLVLAVGSKPNIPKLPGNDFKGVQGLFSYQDLLSLEENTKGIKKAVVSGGGLIGIELVEMLLSRGISVSYLIREFKFWNKVLPKEEGDMVADHMLEHHVDLRLGTEIKEICGDQNNRVNAVQSISGEKIETEFVGLCVGVGPNIEFLKNSEIKTNRGILINEYLETNIQNVYAIGDCAEFEKPLKGRTSLEQIWYTGRMQAETLAQTLCGKRTEYKPNNFFNSAKLFDIEYQVYSRDVILDDKFDSFFYLNSKEKKSIRIYFNPENGLFEGVNLLGVRYRHEVCNRWLNEKRSVEYVLEHLSDANFDPEFYKHYETSLIDIYNKKYNKNISLKKKSWKRILGINQ
jgi:NAD(P)H-nitrite reductase large subunit